MGNQKHEQQKCQLVEQSACASRATLLTGCVANEVATLSSLFFSISFLFLCTLLLFSQEGLT
jgi:hypothetical protein